MPSRFVFPATYIMASRPFGVIYVGSTNDLPRRSWEHRQGSVEGFTKTRGCGMLVWYERHELMAEAVRRELAIKHWKRAWKMQLIEKENSTWRDLYPELA